MRRAALTALVMVLALAAAPVMAQQSQFTGAVLLGEVNAYDAHLDGDFGVGFQLGWNFDEHWSLQGELMFTDPNVDTPQGTDAVIAPGLVKSADVMLGSVNVTYFWPKENSAFVPFVSGGVSWLDIQYNDMFTQAMDPDNVAWGLNMGAGIRYDLAGKTFALGEVRWNSLCNPSVDALQVVVGFGFGLGGE